MLPTRATAALGIRYPIVQAGMARGASNAALVSAVSEAGGLGILGCLNRPLEESLAEIAAIRRATTRPFGVNFVVEHTDWPVFEACLAERVPAFSFFRGEPDRVVGRAKATGATVIYQVTTVPEAEAAIRAGADVLVAQGREAGGHVGPIPLRTILPAIVEVAGDLPVLAAGGIVDGRSLARAICLGASGAMIGTRFLATPEAPVTPGYKQAIVSAGRGATVRTGAWDLIWGRAWPGVQVRSIRNAVIDRWIGREDGIADVRDEINAGIDAATRRDDPSEMDLLAGEGVARIWRVEPAGVLVGQIAGDAARVLAPDS